MRFLHGGIPFGNKDKDFTFLFMRKQSRFFLLISLATLIYLLMPAYTPRLLGTGIARPLDKIVLDGQQFGGYREFRKILVFYRCIRSC